MRPIKLNTNELEKIIEIERKCFSPALRASEQLLRKRFELGHTMLALEQNSALLALISFSYKKFTPQEHESFPLKFEQYSTMPIPKDKNAAFFYNFEVIPDFRGKGLGLTLARQAFQEAISAGCTYAVADLSSPSYLGTTSKEEGVVRQNPLFKKAIDDCLATGRLPTIKEMETDPLLAYYHRHFGFKVWKIIKDFYPQDVRSGGLGIITYKRLKK